MSKVRLCPFLLAGLSCWLFLSGCLSVEIETKASRNLSGIRTYRITLEPMLARLYRSGASAKLFDLPGQDLDRKDGIIALFKKELEGKDGSLNLEWSYRAKTLGNLSDRNDSLYFSKRHAKWWIYYDYYERYLPAKDTSNYSVAVNSNFISRLSLPGQIISCNADSTKGSEVLWVRPMSEVTKSGMVFTATSREINPILLILIPIVLGFVIYLVFRSKLKSEDISQSA